MAPDETDLVRGLELFGRSERLGALDCVLVETAKRGGIGTLVSADRAFAGVDGIELLDPTARDFGQWIRTQ